MARVFEIRESSLLDSAPETLWAHASTPAGVNAELRPLLRMTFPDDTPSFLAGWKPGRRLFRSWILLFGVLPVEYDDLTLVEIDEGRRFLERSTLLTQRVWEHERIIEPVTGAVGAAAGEQAAACVVTDRVRFEPRIGALGALQRHVFALVFRLRHHNLRQRFGGRSLPAR